MRAYVAFLAVEAMHVYIHIFKPTYIHTYIHMAGSCSYRRRRRYYACICGLSGCITDSYIHTYIWQAAVATGDGEDIMRACVAFLAVEAMRAGCTPEEACIRAVRRVR